MKNCPVQRIFPERCLHLNLFNVPFESLKSCMDIVRRQSSIGTLHMRIWNQLLTLILSCFTATTLLANESKVIEYEGERYVKIEVEEDDDEVNESWWQVLDFVVSVRGGADYAKVGGKTVDIKLADTFALPFQYVPEDKWHSTGMWSGLLGIEFPFLNEDLRWQSGVAYYETGHFEVEGDVLWYSEPALDNEEYSYKVKNQRILWENKWLGELDEDVFLYFLFGMGASINKTSDYQENNKSDPDIYINPSFGDETTTSFTYTFGVGLEVPIFEAWRLGVGYQYSDLGEVQLKKIEDQGPGHFRFDSTPTHEVFGSITYLF
jgi:opacity protein-like surface antigen